VSFDVAFPYQLMYIVIVPLTVYFVGGGGEMLWKPALGSTPIEPHLKFLCGAVDLNTKVKQNLKWREVNTDILHLGPLKLSAK
jgi:hypothetical protein